MADTWSIGVILFVFLAGFLPFDEATMSALFKKIQKAEFTYPSWFADDVKDLIGKILVVDPKQRWTIPQIRQHPWWKKDGPYAVDDPTQNGILQEVSSSGEVLDDVDEDETGGNGSSRAGPTSGNTTDTRKINAFDLINMCSGSAVANMFKNDAKNVSKSVMAQSSKPFDEILKYIQQALQKIPGFVEQNLYNEEQDKIKAVYDLGNGQVHVKVALEIADDDLIIVVFKRARGDLISFGKIWDSISRLASSIN